MQPRPHVTNGVLGLMMAGLALLSTAGLGLTAWVWGTKWIAGWFSF